jgi:hypothetical protein
MKYYIIILSFFLYSCSKEEIIPIVNPVQTTISTYTIPISVQGISSNDLSNSINGSVSGTTLYSVGGVLHLVITPTDFVYPNDIPPLHFINKNNSWVYESSYIEGSMGGCRDTELFDDNGTIVYGDQGKEPMGLPFPYGHIYMSKTIGDKLSFTRISNTKSFYHSISVGDINKDGLKDIIGLSMGTYGSWDKQIHSYIQNTNGTFTEDRNIISYNNWMGNYGAGSILISDIFPVDGYPEIICGDYTINEPAPSIRYSFVIFQYSTITKKYEMIHSPGVMGFSLMNVGITSMKSSDMDNDGDKDIIVAYEGRNINGIEIWNNVDNKFSPGMKKEFNINDFQFREFDVMDIDNDGDIDITINPVNKISNLKNNILINNKNSLDYGKDIIISSNPTYMKGFNINGKLIYIGIKGNVDNTIQITQINLNGLN